MPQATSALVPEPETSSTFIGRMLAAHAIPAMPIPLSPMAAAMPATCVPCPLSSSVTPPGATQFVPINILPLNSGSVLETPVSTTATTELALPAVTPQAAGALIFCGPHCFVEKNGSLGSTNARYT